MSVVKKFISDTAIYGLTTILSRMLSFLMTPLLTKKFATAVYGVFTNLYAYASMINAILAFGMETTFFRYLQKVEGNKQKVFDTSFFVTIISSALFVLTVLTFANPIGYWLSNGENVAEYVTFVKYFAVILAADALAVVPFAKLRAEGRPIKYGVIKIANILIYVFFILFFLYFLPYLTAEYTFWKEFASGWFREGWLGNVFIANLIASVVTLVMLIPQMISFRFRVDGALIKQMLSYTFPILIANISFIINENLDKMMLPRLIPGERGDSELGIYGAVAKIAVFLNLFVTAFRLGAEPFFFSYSKNENARKTYAMIMEYFIIAMLVVMVGICANIDWLKYFIPSKEGGEQNYWSGLFIVPVLLLNYVLLGIYMNLSVWYKLSDQTRYALYISGIGALATIVLNFALIPTYSYVGAAISTTITYLLMVTLSYVWGQKNYSIPYNVKKIAAYMLLGVALAFAAFHLHFWIGNLLFIIFLSIVAYLEKNMLLKVLRRR